MTPILFLDMYGNAKIAPIEGLPDGVDVGRRWTSPRIIRIYNELAGDFRRTITLIIHPYGLITVRDEFGGDVRVRVFTATNVAEVDKINRYLWAAIMHMHELWAEHQCD